MTTDEFLATLHADSSHIAFITPNTEEGFNGFTVLYADEVEEFTPLLNTDEQIKIWEELCTQGCLPFRFRTLLFNPIHLVRLDTEVVDGHETAIIFTFIRKNRFLQEYDDPGRLTEDYLLLLTHLEQYQDVRANALSSAETQ